MAVEASEKLGSTKQIKAFYDRLGGWLDTQRFFKTPALNALLKYSEFEDARYVFELGCGTGRLAEKILARNLALHYHGTDLSSTMVRLTQNRLKRFGSRTTITTSDGGITIPLPDGTIDRFVCTYVLDLMAASEIRSALNEVHRVLKGNGRACLVSLTASHQWLGGVLTSMWSSLHRINPMLLGGCRPLELLDFIDQRKYRIQHLDRLASFGLTSEVLVAERLNRQLNPADNFN